jgi:signal transduction histidine kinase
MLVVLAVALGCHTLIGLASGFALIRGRTARPRLFWYAAATVCLTLAQLVQQLDSPAAHWRGWLAIEAVGAVTSHGGVWLMARTIDGPDRATSVAPMYVGLVAAIALGGARLAGLPDGAFELMVNMLAFLSGAASFRAIRRSTLGPDTQPRILLIGFALFVLIALHDIARLLGLVGGPVWMSFAFIIVLLCFVLFRTIEHEALVLHERRQTAALKARARELEEANRALSLAKAEISRQAELAVVGELAAVIAHEVRNPLAIISNAVAGLRKPLPKGDHETLLTIVDEETSRLNNLVRDLLRYARPIELQRQEVDVSEMLTRISALGRVPTRVVGEPGVTVSGDPTLLRQAIENLRDNALQAVGETGEVTMLATLTDSDVEIKVRDTGEGMDTLVLKRAKDAFFTTRSTGTGLGLALVDRIANAHGGIFTIESRPGVGTTASIKLPRQIVPGKVTLSSKPLPL